MAVGDPLRNGILILHYKNEFGVSFVAVPRAHPVPSQRHYFATKTARANDTIERHGLFLRRHNESRRNFNLA